MIEKYRSCLGIIMHLRGVILWCIIDYVGIFGNTSYGCLLLRFSSDFHTLLLTLRWPFFLYFCIFFCCDWVFAGICFWYFPLPAGALDLRPWPFCRPGRKLTGPGTDPGTTQTVSNSALLYCFCPYPFLYCYIFCFVYLYFDPGTDPSTIDLDALLLSFFYSIDPYTM